VYDYPHVGAPLYAITGGYVYRGSLLKEIYGEYFFADSETGEVWSMDTDPASGALLPNTVRDRTGDLNPFFDKNNPFLKLCGIVSFGEDSGGNLYVLDLSGGQLFEVVPEPRTYAIMLCALAAMAWMIRRRRELSGPRPIFNRGGIPHSDDFAHAVGFDYGRSMRRLSLVQLVHGGAGVRIHDHAMRPLARRRLHQFLHGVGDLLRLG
jgi:hypothetical protein